MIKKEKTSNTLKSRTKSKCEIKKKIVTDISFYICNGWLLNHTHRHSHSLRIGDKKKNLEKK